MRSEIDYRFSSFFDHHWLPAQRQSCSQLIIFHNSSAGFIIIPIFYSSDLFMFLYIISSFFSLDVLLLLLLLLLRDSFGGVFCSQLSPWIIIAKQLKLTALVEASGRPLIGRLGGQTF